MRKYKGYRIFRLDGIVFKWGAHRPGGLLIDVVAPTLKELYIGINGSIEYYKNKNYGKTTIE